MAVGGGKERAPWLVADIGGTNARFAVYPPLLDPAAEPLASGRLKTADYPGPAECARAFLEQHWKEPIGRAALAIAAPVTGDEVSLTNAAWRFSVRQLRRDLGIQRLDLINDFAALAHALPLLGAGDRLPVGPDLPAEPERPIAVIGPGTGLGTSAALSHEQRGWAVVAGEAGHTTAAARCEREAAILALLRRDSRHVSYERVASGPGLVELAGAVAKLGAAPAPPQTPAGVVEAARAGDEGCREAVSLFQGFLATFVGDMALTFGALGGVYLAGGVLSHLDDLLDVSAFRARMEDKGRFRDYLARIPVWRLNRPDVAYLGLRRLLLEHAEDEGTAA